ncbi:MAG: hypothetical protein VB778_04030 [Nitrospinaceae bacterium]
MDVTIQELDSSTLKTQQSVSTQKSLQPIGYEEEKFFWGGRLAVEVFSGFGGDHDNPRLLLYINMVGKALYPISGKRFFSKFKRSGIT